jgi:hypothetical protein
MNETMMDGKKYIEKDYATKGVAGTALGLGIGALGLEFLRNGGLGNILGTGTNNVPFEESAFGLYKNQRDQYDELLAKHNQDSFSLFKGYTDAIASLKAEVDALKTKIAVGEATQPWKEKSLYDAIAIEAERRECADNKIVNYANSTFVPKYIAEMTVGTGSTQSVVYNPLCGC